MDLHQTWHIQSTDRPDKNLSKEIFYCNNCATYQSKSFRSQLAKHEIFHILPKVQPFCTNFQIYVQHTIKNIVTRNCGLSTLGGAIIVQNLYLINRCTDWHENIHISSEWSCESIHPVLSTFATVDALGGAFKAKTAKLRKHSPALQIVPKQ